MWYNKVCMIYIYTRKGINMELSEFIKKERSKAKLTQPDLALKAGVGLRFVREMEQGKETLRLDKVNQVLALFGCQLGPIKMDPQKENDL